MLQRAVVAKGGEKLKEMAHMSVWVNRYRKKGKTFEGYPFPLGGVGMSHPTLGSSVWYEKKEEPSNMMLSIRYCHHAPT